MINQAEGFPQKLFSCKQLLHYNYNPGGNSGKRFLTKCIIIVPVKAFSFIYKQLIFLHENIGWGYSLEARHQVASNEYLQKMFHVEIKEIFIYLIYRSLETHPYNGGKHFRPRSDAAECSIRSGSPLLQMVLPFSLGISKSHSWIFLKLKLDSSNI